MKHVRKITPAILWLAILSGVLPTARATDPYPGFVTLNFANTSTYADTDIYFLFSSNLSHVSGNVTYGNFSGTVVGGTTASGSYAPADLSGTVSAGGQYWGQGNLYSGTNPAYTDRYVGYTLDQLKAGGVQLAYADSTTVYMSVGAPMFLTGSNSISTFGTPTLTTSSDPNWGVRWQPFEISRTSTFISGTTYNGGAGDQANLTAINAYAVPLQMKSYSSGTMQQTVRTVAPNLAGDSLKDSLHALAASNTANSSNWSFSGSYPAWQVTGSSGEFLRQVGPSTGATGILMQTPVGNGTVTTGTFFSNQTLAPTYTGAPSSNGPYPTFASYVQYVGTANSGSSYLTPMSFANAANVPGGGATTSWAYSATASVVPFSGANVSGTWINRMNPSGNGAISGNTTNTGELLLSGTGYAVQITGSIYATGSAGGTSVAGPGTWVGSFIITLPPDQTPMNGGGSANIGYSQAASLYGSVFTPAGNYFSYNDLTGSNPNLTGNYLRFTDLPYDYAIWSQIGHDIGVGYNLGLVGSTTEIPGYASGTSLNDMGSDGWTKFKSLYTSGTYTGSAMPVYEQAWGGTATGFYNQWSKVIFDNTNLVYGNPYSDFTQPVQIGVNVADQGATTQGAIIDTIDITVLPDVVPEAMTWSLLVVAGGIFWAARRRKTRSSKDA